VKELDQVVVGAKFHGFYGAVHHVVGTHHEDDRGGVDLLHAAEDFHAVNAGKYDVEQSEIGLFLGEDGERDLTGSRGEDFKAPRKPRETVRSVRSSSSTTSTE
jgi:hypothetical protein